MLYGKKNIQNEILRQVENFEKRYNKKVVFGAMVGSISKGVERYDSDYDTRFLYLEPTAQGFVRWDKMEEEIKECQIHQCYVPGDKDCYVDGVYYRNNYHRFELEDKELFYDKIAFWELTSYINFLVNPRLDNKLSVGLYHIVPWTFNSPYCWDPYGLKSKISCLLDELFIGEYEIQYYKRYIQNTLKRNPVKLREYLYSAYYALAIDYCIRYNRFAPVYFKSLLAMCSDEKLKTAIVELETEYYCAIAEKICEGEEYKRKMANSYSTARNNVIDDFLDMILSKAERYNCNNVKASKKDYVDRIIRIIVDSLERPIVKNVND